MKTFGCKLGLRGRDRKITIKIQLKTAGSGSEKLDLRYLLSITIRCDLEISKLIEVTKTKSFVLHEHVFHMAQFRDFQIPLQQIAGIAQCCFTVAERQVHDMIASDPDCPVGQQTMEETVFLGDLNVGEAVFDPPGSGCRVEELSFPLHGYVALGEEVQGVEFFVAQFTFAVGSAEEVEAEFFEKVLDVWEGEG